MLRFLASTLLLASLSESLVLQPPENQWVLHGQEVKLLCKSSEPINTCTWSTPYNSSYTLSPGLVAEKGRLKHFATDEEKECGILITKVEDQDHGAWMCNVGTIMNSEVQSASGKASVEMAQKPKSIKLSEPFHAGAVNLSEVSSNEQSAVKCVVAEARPKPVFSWYIGDEELSDLDTEDDQQEDESTWTQTLLYKPEAGHANRSLRCVVQHITLGDEDSKQAEVLLQFTPSDKELLINKSANAHVPLIVVSVIVPIFLIFVVTCSYFNQHIFVRKSSADVSLDDAEGAGEDVEKKINIGLESLEMPEGIAGTDSKPGQEKENEAFEAEEKNAAAANAEQPKAGLKERVASFFRFGTAAAARIDEEAVMVEEVAEKVEEVAEKIVEAAEKVENAAAKVAEAAEEVMEESKSKTKVAVENETAKRSGGFVRLLKIFSNQKREAEAEKAAEDPKKEEVSDEEKVKADEAENEKGEDAKEEEEKKAEEPAPAATEEESLEKPKDKEEE